MYAYICNMKKQLNAIKQLRVIGIAEGISYLVLLLISMPLKYLANLPQAVIVNGWIHGGLFVLFAISVLYTWIVCSWPFKRAFTAGVLSLVPFGTFWFDKGLKRDQALLEKQL